MSLKFIVWKKKSGTTETEQRTITAYDFPCLTKSASEFFISFKDTNVK